MLEIGCHSNTEWCTLTYAPEFLPTGGTLIPSHLSQWIKSLRQDLARQAKRTGIRFFGVGEYGSKTKRPHYHVFLFGLMPWERGLAEKCWRYGHVMWAPDPQNSKIAEYTAGYTVKKEGKDAEKLVGRCPEFSRMSLRPPIGGKWATDLGSRLADSKFFVEELPVKGFPTTVSIGGKVVPLGRTLSRYVRVGLGYGPTASEEEKRTAQWIREQTFVNEEYQAERLKRRQAGAARALSRQSIFGKRETL